MPIDYTIKAIPTLYRGVQYRSRLEARWAAMFDKLNWVHVYEPFDLGVWSPDFMIGAKGEHTSCVLVEVKPITFCDEETLDRMVRACRAGNIFDIVGNFAGVLLLGVSPVYVNWHKPVGLGWYRIGDLNPEETQEVSLGWRPENHSPSFTADLVKAAADGWFAALTGDGGFRHNMPIRFYADHTIALWKEAINATQWSPAQ